MLVVSRKIGERILIGDQITVTVIKIGSGVVRIGIEAPRELAVVREELARQIDRSLADGESASTTDLSPQSSAK
jgi:carbon storage regulator